MVSPDVAEYNLHPIGMITLPIPLVILSTIAVSLRLWVRIRITNAFGTDDVFLILAQIFFVASCVDFILLGLTEWNDGLGSVLKLAVHSVLGITLYLITQICFKLSLAFFFLRIVRQRWHRMVIITSVTVFILFNIALLVVSITQCGNIATIDVNNLSCLDWDTIQGPLNYFGAGLNAVVDWIFAITSILVVSNLCLGTRDKLSVYGIIILASTGSIVSIVRIPYIPGLRLDTSYYSSKNDIIAYTSLIEAAIGIIVASGAVLKPLGRRLLQQARIKLSSSPTSSPVATSQRGVEMELEEQKKPRHAPVELFKALPTPVDTFNKVPVNCLDEDLEKGPGALESEGYGRPNP